MTYDLSGNTSAQSNSGPSQPPAFQLTASYLIANSNGFLAVSAPLSGTGPFTYQWLFNGTNISGATNDTVFLPNATSLNLGAYQLIASNSFGAVTSAVVNVSFDSDHNGLPDTWEMTYFAHLGNDRNSDPDGDGVSNFQEYLDGTNPTNPNSVFPRLLLSATAGGTVSVTPWKPKYQLGETVQIIATPNPGISFIGWVGSISNTNTTVSFVMNTMKTITGAFGIPLDVALDTTNFVWTTGGDALWFGQPSTTSDGVDAAQSGLISNSQQSWIQTSVSSANLIRLAFNWSINSETNSDYLSLYTNGVLVSRISGIAGWRGLVYFLPPGSYSLRWTYAKDGADNSLSSNRAWLDQVQVSTTTATTNLFTTSATAKGGMDGDLFLSSANGIFDFLTDSGIYNLGIETGATPNRFGGYSAFRFALEFNLPTFPAGVVINRATLSVRNGLAPYGGPDTVAGYVGNGVVTLADMTIGTDLLTFSPSGGYDLLDVTSFIQAQYASKNAWAGFMFRQNPQSGNNNGLWDGPGASFQPILTIDYGPASQPTTIILTSVTRPPGGALQFSFTNTPGLTFTSLTTTNITLALSNWTVLGSVSEISPGYFQFTDAQAPTNSQRFYRVRSP